jgi:hypothetical protein
MKIRSFLPIFVILLGIAFTVFLMVQIPEGFYFSGDAGLKAKLAQQLAQGTGRFDLIPPPQPWVQDLWQKGLYPYSPPYVYRLSDRYFITFPYTFPLVTSPFYRLFGYWGLYIVPILGTWVTWVLFYGACRILKFSDHLTTLGLGVFIFASPFTPYGVMYWEHSLAVALAFSSIVLLLWRFHSITNSLVSQLISIVSGLFLGLSIWFRPEFLCLVGLFGFICLAQEISKLRFVDSFLRKINVSSFPKLISYPYYFIFSTVISTSLFFVSNYFIYGHYLGIHGIQVVEKASFIQKLQNMSVGFRDMGLVFILFMPVVCFVFFYIFALMSDHKRLRPSFTLLNIYLLSLILIASIAFLVPAGTAGSIPGGLQWGSRFLLILVPILILATVQILNLILIHCQRWIRYVGIALFSMLVFLGIYKNTFEGSVYLYNAYQNSAPAIDFLAENPESVVAVSHQFVSQIFESATQDKKLWFIVETPENLQDLSQALLKEQITHFFYICYPHRDCPLAEKDNYTKHFENHDQIYSINFEFIGNKGKYPIYRVSIGSNKKTFS